MLEFWTQQFAFIYHYQLADGMTIQVTTVNLLLETRGGAQCGGGATW